MKPRHVVGISSRRRTCAAVQVCCTSQKWLLGPFDSLFRLVVSSGAGVATGDFGQTVESWRSLLSPTRSLLVDWLTGENAIGDPTPQIFEFQAQDVPELAERVGQSFVPIAARNAPETIRQTVRAESPVEAAAGAVGTAAEFSGYKTSPLGFTDVAD